MYENDINISVVFITWSELRRRLEPRAYRLIYTHGQSRRREWAKIFILTLIHIRSNVRRDAYGIYMRVLHVRIRHPIGKVRLYCR